MNPENEKAIMRMIGKNTQNEARTRAEYRVKETKAIVKRAFKNGKRQGKKEAYFEMREFLENKARK